MLVYPAQNELYPVGAIVDSNVPPDNRWYKCNGDILAKADYPTYSLLLDSNALPGRFQHWEVNYRAVYGLGLYSDEQISVVENNGSRWIAGGPDTLIYSDDCETWSNCTLPYTGVSPYPAHELFDLCNDGNSTWVASGFFQGNDDIYQKILYSTNNGTSWSLTSTQVLNVNSNYYAVCFDGTKFVCVSDSTNEVLFSNDGSNWSIGSYFDGDFTFTWNVRIASNGNGVIVATDGYVRAISIDGGLNWTYGVGNGYDQLVSYVNGNFFITNNDESRAVFGVSQDGIDWEFYRMPLARRAVQNQIYYNTQMASGSRSACKVRYFANNYILVGAATSGLSLDLKLWEPLQSVESVSWADCCYNPSTGYLYFFSDVLGGYDVFKTKMVVDYDTSTHFKLPNLMSEQIDGMVGQCKYIRLR